MNPSFLRSILVTLLASFVLSGCAALGIRRSVPQDELAKAHRIGVFGTMGQDFHMFHLGFTVFGNERSTSQVDWDINGFTVDTALGLLKGNPALDPAAFAFTRTGKGRLEEDPSVWERARDQGFDHLVFIRPGVSQNHQLWKPGVGLTEQGGPFTARCVYAGYVVYVYSVATREVVGWQWGGKQDDICTPNSAKDIPFRKNFDDYSTAEKATLHERLNERIVESMKSALQTLDLVPEAKTPPTASPR